MCCSSSCAIAYKNRDRPKLAKFLRMIQNVEITERFAVNWNLRYVQFYKIKESI